jgi:hypothetical protein
MNNVSPAKKEAILKSLAIIGFFVVIVLVAWIAVKAVAVAPKAFSSLASIAEGLDQYKDAVSESDEELVVVTDKDLVESGKPMIISWEKDIQAGTYSFSYDCQEGVVVDVLEAEGLRALTCDTNHPLGDTDAVTIIPASQQTEPVTLTYSVLFTHEIDSKQTRSGSGEVVLAQAEVFPIDTPDPVLDTNDQSDFEDDVATPLPTTPSVVPVTPKPTTPKPTNPTYTYAIPTSNPNGYTDLGSLFLGVGDITNNKFVTGTIERNGMGAFQFEVKNYGTRTSEKWTYSVTLPDGDTYTSPSQEALKPNERAVITLGFDVGDDTSHTFTVTVKTTRDTTSSNNTFKKSVTFTR